MNTASVVEVGSLNSSVLLSGPGLLAIAAVAVITLLLGFVVWYLIRKDRVALMPDQAKDLILQAEERARSIVAEAAAEARQARLENGPGH
jgi:peptidoglycan/LPS O-acetylase OafA/YrhL